MQTPGHILITGGSSGIGAALARHYAMPGVRLTITGRDEGRIEETCQTLRAAGAQAEGTRVPVTDARAMADLIARAEAARPLDLVIANAGISAGTGGAVESAAQLREVLAVNLDGVVNTLLPALDAMTPRGRGQIALMSSLASFRGLPGAPAYSASKAAVRALGEAMRGDLAPRGIAVNVICPGFVKSRITDANPFPMPGLMDSDRAARLIARGLARNRSRIAFPFRTHFGAWLLGTMPAGLADRILARMPRKI